MTFFSDLGRSMHYFKEAREHRPPVGLMSLAIFGVYVSAIISLMLKYLSFSHIFQLSL